MPPTASDPRERERAPARPCRRRATAPPRISASTVAIARRDDDADHACDRSDPAERACGRLQVPDAITANAIPSTHPRQRREVVVAEERRPPAAGRHVVEVADEPDELERPRRCRGRGDAGRARRDGVRVGRGVGRSAAPATSEQAVLDELGGADELCGERIASLRHRRARPAWQRPDQRECRRTSVQPPRRSGSIAEPTGRRRPRGEHDDEVGQSDEVDRDARPSRNR